MRPVCANGEDDDEDGIIDFPFDPGCNFAADVDEADPAFPPQCANGNDDDQNGRVDFPDDIGCAFAADRNERSDGRIPRRCADGVDNDADGLVDCSDSECRTLAVCGGDPAGGGNSGYGDGNQPPDGGGNGP